MGFSSSPVFAKSLKMSNFAERKRKEAVLEARRAGTLAPATDAAGNLFNPHVPEFMSQAPWYARKSQDEDAHITASQDGTANQRSKDLDKWYKRGASTTASTRATKYQRGACRNCGSRTHTKKECLERPRRRGADVTGSNLAKDDVVQEDLGLTYDGRRDRYNGFDVDSHMLRTKRIVQTQTRERAKVREEKKKRKRARREEKKRKRREERKDDDQSSRSSSPSSSDDDDDSESESGLTAASGATGGLRIRQDTAKYLRNLDVDSAHYDPKTRSMRENPTPWNSESDFVGDSFAKGSEDVDALRAAEAFSEELSKKTDAQVHATSNPTSLAIQAKKQIETAENEREAKRRRMMSKYGGGDSTSTSTPALPVLPPPSASSTTYVEYDEHGNVKPLFRSAQKKTYSRWPENVFVDNHTSVWGSYFDCTTLEWGYACCRQTMKKCYCTKM